MGNRRVGDNKRNCAQDTCLHLNKIPTDCVTHRRKCTKKTVYLPEVCAETSTGLHLGYDLEHQRLRTFVFKSQTNAIQRQTGSIPSAANSLDFRKIPNQTPTTVLLLSPISLPISNSFFARGVSMQLAFSPIIPVINVRPPTNKISNLSTPRHMKRKF